MKQEPENNENCVYIGKKEITNYIFAVSTQAEKYSVINVKARGRNTSKAIDVSLISLKRFLPNWIIDKIDIYTENMEREEGGEGQISVISIILEEK